MIPYLRRALPAHLARSRTLYLLAVFGVSLGVASVLSIQILSANALSAFRGSARAVSASSDLTLVGNLPVIPESLLTRVLDTPGVEAAWPVHRVPVAVHGAPGLFLDVLGVDVLAPVTWPVESRNPEARGEGSDGVRSELAAMLGRPGWAAVTPGFAASRGLAVGDSLRVSHGARPGVLRIGALVDFRRISPLASDRLVLMDIAQAQHAFGKRGEITEIEIRLAEGQDREATARLLGERTGPGTRIVTPESRERDAEGLLAAFRLNLTALSLVSLFVGLFLVHESVQASLVRRRGEFGLLRSLGATRGQAAVLVLTEAALLGAAGTGLGLVIGRAAASLALAPVSATLTNVYLLGEIESLRIGPGLYALAIAVGLGGAVAGALLPALDMARRDARSLLLPVAIHERAGRLAGPLAGTGVLVLVGTSLWYLTLGREIREGGFVLAAALLLGLPLLTPAGVRFACRLLPARGFGWGYGFRTLGLRLHTTSFAVAALGVAVTMMVSITLLVGSFRRTLETWVDATLTADVYVTTESWARGGPGAALGPDLLRDFGAAPGVREVESLRQTRVRVGDRTISLAGIAFAPGLDRLRIPLRSGDPARALREVRASDAAIVSEPLARRRSLAVGDSLVLETATGRTALRVAAISYDYSSEAGNVLVSMETFARLAGEGPVQNVALFLAPGADPEAAVSALRGRFPALPLVIRSQTALRAEVLRIFDQTFAVTRLLQGMALLVAATGISLALLVTARERRSELALYRALGSLRGQILGLFLREALIMGALGLALGTIGGLALAAVLIRVINPAFFGWTIRPAWPWPLLLQEGLAILFAAALAGVIPALRASRMPARDLARDAL